MDFKMKEQSQVYSGKNHHVKRSKNEKPYFDFIEILSGWPFVISAPKMMDSILILTTFLLSQVCTVCY